MPIYTEIHDFKQSNIPAEQQNMAIIQVQPAADISYEKYLTGLVAQALWEYQCTWIILPKGSCNESLDRTLTKLIQQQDHDVILIYGNTIEQGREHSTIAMKRGKQIKYYFQPALTPYNHGDQCRHIFVNTGLGDFAVLPADTLETEQLQYLGAWVDVLVITARNKETITFNQILQEHCATTYNIVAYANQSVLTEYDEEDQLKILGGESGFYIPYQEFQQRKVKMIPTGKQDITVFPLNIALLDKARSGQNITYPNATSPTLIAPTNIITPRYSSSARDETYWRNLLAKQESSQKASIVLEQWQVMPKETNKWKYIVKTKETTISEFPCVLGRSSRSNVMLENHKVSGQHAELIQEEGVYCLRDLESTGGTFLLEKKRISLPIDKEMEISIGEFFWLTIDHCFCLRCQEKGPVMLEFWEDHAKVSEIPIPEFPAILGLGNSRVPIPNLQGVAQQHARLYHRDGKFFLQAKSEAGTFIWPHRPYVKLKSKLQTLQSQTIQDGDLFCLSQEVFFRVIIPKDSSGIGRHIYSLED